MFCLWLWDCSVHIECEYWLAVCIVNTTGRELCIVLFCFYLEVAFVKRKHVLAHLNSVVARFYCKSVVYQVEPRAFRFVPHCVHFRLLNVKCLVGYLYIIFRTGLNWIELQLLHFCAIAFCCFFNLDFWEKINFVLKSSQHGLCRWNVHRIVWPEDYATKSQVVIERKW